MKPDNFDIAQLVEDLQGTCGNISDHLPEGMVEEDLTDDDHNYIDNEIFLCEQCGWWCETSEASEQEEYEGYCNGCAGDE